MALWRVSHKHTRDHEATPKTPRNSVRIPARDIVVPLLLAAALAAVAVARDGYALLELVGKDAALKAARKELSARFARRRAATPAAEAAEA